MKFDRRWAIAGLLLLCIAALVWMFGAREAPPAVATNANVVSGVVGVVALVLVLVPLWRSVRDRQALDLAPQVVALADAVAVWLRREEETRRIEDPVPLPVSWRAGDPVLRDRSDNVGRVRVGGLGPAVPLDGFIDEVADAYRAVPSGRLVVLGAPGSGKTVLVTRLALDLLESRRSEDPVPVVFPVSEWDPHHPLRGWLERQLTRTYGTDAAAAAALVSSGRILPILDGFDEIIEPCRDEAITSLNGIPSLRLVITSRPDEYTTAITERGVLSAAAVIHLDDITPDVLRSYLPRTDRRPCADGISPWTAVLDDPTVTTALSTPLMVYLAREIYADADPADLLALPGVTAIQRHLFRSYLPAVYRVPAPGGRAWPAETAESWLRLIARRTGEQGITWWTLAGGTRNLATTAAALALTSVLAAAAMAGMVANLSHNWSDGLLTGALVGGAFLVLAACGLMIADLAVNLVIAVPRTDDHLARRATLWVSVGYGLIVAVGAAPVAGWKPALMFGVAAGFFEWGALFEPLLEGGMRAYALNFRKGLRVPAIPGLPTVGAFAAGIGLMATAVAVVVVRPVHIVDGQVLLPITARIGFMFLCFFALFSSTLLTRWGQWVLVVHVWDVFTGRLPRRTVTFLEDSWQRGVLRQSGATYRFRHDLLRQYLNEPDQR